MKSVCVAALAGAVAATDVSLAWKDCGDASTHVKITAFAPTSLTLGQKTTMTGTGIMDEDVSAATFDLEMTGIIGKIISCSGDASTGKTCHLPFGVGSLTYDAMSFPIKKGSVPVNVDIQLSASLPKSLAKTTTVAKATASNGDKLFCMQINSAPAAETVIIEEPAVQGGSLALTWKDCGDASTHAKITDFAPTSLTLGQKTTMTGTGIVDEDVSAATFDLEMTGIIGKLLSCNGDASTGKTCHLPLGVGSLTYDAMSLPIKKGSVPVNVDIQLSASLPKSLAKTTTVAKATASNGDKLFCMQINSAPAAETVIV